MTRRLALTIVHETGRWPQRKNLGVVLAPALPLVMEKAAAFLPPGDYAMTLALSDDDHVKSLNRQFRGINKPTNVLSFPAYGLRDLRRLKAQKQPVFLGDIILSYQYIVSETKKHHKILICHIIHLAIHGILHNLGYDHVTERRAAVMERLEREILQALQISDPYQTPAVSGRQRLVGNATPKTA